MALCSPHRISYAPIRELSFIETYITWPKQLQGIDALKRTCHIDITTIQEVAMLRFFTSRELSDRLSIPPAKWKRWSREFLPPDPLGGLQSGVARQFSVDEALTVLMGGHLVAELKASIPAARQILSDLQSFLQNIGFFANSRIDRRFSSSSTDPILEYTIRIYRDRRSASGAARFLYVLRGNLSGTSEEINGRKVCTQRYIEEFILPSPASLPQRLSHRTLNLSALADFFATAVGVDKGHFPILNGRR